MRAARVIPALALAGALLGCAEPAPQEDPYDAPFDPEYLGVETRLLDGDLVNFLVSMRGARGPRDIETYAECAAAQYALIRGYGFARHVRTNLSERGGLWRADAVYTISESLPQGLNTIHADDTTSACAENEIPMV